MKIYSQQGYIFFDNDFDLNENISVVKTIQGDNSFNFSSTKLGSFDVLFSSIEHRTGLPYPSETRFESIFLNGINLNDYVSAGNYKQNFLFIGS